MRDTLLKALKIFIVLALLFYLGYWVYTVYDDYYFIDRYGLRAENLLLWWLYSIAYLITFSFYYWVFAFAVILVYHKIIRRSDRRPKQE
jgi:hypothetical protein